MLNIAFVTEDAGTAQANGLVAEFRDEMDFMYVWIRALLYRLEIRLLIEQLSACRCLL